MAFDFGATQEYTEEATLTIFGQPLKVKFYPDRYTIQLEEQANAKETGGLAWFLAQLIQSWDAVEKGEPVPVTEEVLAARPVFRARLWEQLQAAMRGGADTGEARGGASSSGSRQEEYAKNAPPTGS